jgi:D-glycero-D-manno-heptose 1,7-bisphosphate phosphatase
MNKALFLDRDGVINRNFGHVYKINKVVFLKGIFDFASHFFNKGYIIFIITNQAGISKGLYSLKDFYIISNYITAKFKEKGIIITETFFCPHRLEDNCNCRKPKPGLLLNAINKYNIDPNQSFMVGDKITDYDACKNANLKNCIIKEKNFTLEKLLLQLNKTKTI